MYTIILILTFVIGINLIYQLYSRYSLKNFSVKKAQKKIAYFEKQRAKEIKKREQTKKFLIRLTKITQSIPFFKQSKSYKEHLNYVSIRLGLEWNDVKITGDYIGAFIDLVRLIYICILLLLGLTNYAFILLLLLIQIIPTFILFFLDAEIDDMDKEISSEFYRFHSTVYNIYKYESNWSIPIDQVLKRYYENAGLEIRKFINYTCTELQANQSSALQNVKKHYHSIKVQKLCNELQPLITGKPFDVSRLENFQDELLNEHRVDRREKLDKQMIKAERIFMLAEFMIVEVVIVWIAYILILNN